MSAAINVLLKSVSVSAVEVTKLGDAEPDVVPGSTTVLFRLADGQAFDLDWTWRGTPPPVGSKWTLVPEVEA